MGRPNNEELQNEDVTCLFVVVSSLVCAFVSLNSAEKQTTMAPEDGIKVDNKEGRFSVRVLKIRIFQFI